jgi:hypothetical protein
MQEITKENENDQVEYNNNDFIGVKKFRQLAVKQVQTYDSGN